MFVSRKAVNRASSPAPPSYVAAPPAKAYLVSPRARERFRRVRADSASARAPPGGLRRGTQPDRPRRARARRERPSVRSAALSTRAARRRPLHPPYFDAEVRIYGRTDE